MIETTPRDFLLFFCGFILHIKIGGRLADGFSRQILFSWVVEVTSYI